MADNGIPDQKGEEHKNAIRGPERPLNHNAVTRNRAWVQQPVETKYLLIQSCSVWVAGRVNSHPLHRVPEVVMFSTAQFLFIGIAAIAAPITACAQTADSARSTASDPVTYILTAGSRLEVKTGKSGLLGFAGHDHIIRANHPSGRIVYDPSPPSNSRVEISVLTRNLEVLTPPDTAEIRKVTEAMRTEVLFIDRHPEITFVSKSVTPIEGGFRVLGSLTISGKSRDVTVDLATTIDSGTLRAEGSFSVKQTDFGIKPYRGGPGGTVRVADKVEFRLKVVATSKS